MIYLDPEKLRVRPLEKYRRAAIRAANLGYWKKAAAFLKNGAKRTQQIKNTDRYIGRYIGMSADAGFAYFKAGNMSNCIKFLYLALQKFEMLPQDRTDLKYLTLKKRLEYTIKWIWMVWCTPKNDGLALLEPHVGFCSDSETKEEVLNLPNHPIGYSWYYLSEIEYRFGHETTVFQHLLQTVDREEYPIMNLSLSILEINYDFRNKSFDNLPTRLQQLSNIFNSIKKHLQSGKGIGEEEIGFIPAEDVPNFTSIEDITVLLIAPFFAQLSTDVDAHEILRIWRANSSELPIKEHLYSALDLMESILLGDSNHIQTVLDTDNEEEEAAKLLLVSLKVVHNAEASLDDLFLAHLFISGFYINNLWGELVVNDLAVHISSKWLEKIQLREALKILMTKVTEIEQACNSSETGKRKIGQILLAVQPTVSVDVLPETLQQLQSWTESDQERPTRKNPAAQRLIKAMEKPPHLTDEDIDALNQSIKEGKIPIKFDSPFDSDDSENSE